jgi:hypothetical protein
MDSKIIAIGVLFLLTIISGIWLHNTGKPLNTLIFTIHKLLALAAVIFTSIAIYNLHKNVEIKTIILILIVIAGLSLLALFISGALLSIGKPTGNIILTVHNIVTILAVFSTAVTIYLLVR